MTLLLVLAGVMLPCFQALGGEDNTGEKLEETVEEYIDLSALEEIISETAEEEQFSFIQTIRLLIRGELPFSVSKIPEKLIGSFLDELRQQKWMAVQILVIALTSAVLSNFVKVLENSQIAEISFYMMYLLISAMLIRSFLSMNEIVARTLESINSFMKILLPGYLICVVFCSGTVAALGFYEIAVIGMNLLQTVILKAVLPAVNIYLVILILSQMSKEDYFSHLADLAETAIGWVTKTILGIVIGLQAVQCLIAPAVDSMKSSAVHRLAKAIPGIGSVLDSAVETVAGSALVLKNAVGVAGILALGVICMVPFIKLGVSVFLFRLLCALIQPVSEKRMVEGIESISRSTIILFKVLFTGVSIFVISLAMITASVRGG